MSETRFTYSQTLCGLREVWENATGTNATFSAETRIYDYMQEDGSWAEIDFADIFYRIERTFGFDCPREEWMTLFGESGMSAERWLREVSPKLTFGALAQFIAERTPDGISFEPANFLNQKCAPAGAFLGMEELAKRNSVPEFAPSDRIIDVMRGNVLDSYWHQLRWMTEDRIPALPRLWRGILVDIGFFGSIAIALVAYLVGLKAAFIASAVWAVCLLSASAYKDLTNPIPAEVQTFRDLAELVSR